MAELPEIVKLAEQMNQKLKGKKIKSLTLNQEKCINIPEDEFKLRSIGGTITHVEHKGKWIITSLDNGENLLMSLGMGADVLYFEQEKKLPEKYQVKLNFTDGTGYTIRFWWFGKFLLCAEENMAEEKNIKDIGLDPWSPSFTRSYFIDLLEGRRTQVKSFLLNQKNISGIGNMYMHDILFRAGLHPKKKISDLSKTEKNRLYDSILDILNFSREKGTFSYESDFFGEKGGYDHFIVGYKENEPCPDCNTEIVMIKTGSTTSYLCPACQVL